MTRIIDSNGPLSFEQIEKFESKHGISLSEQYRGFLHEYNGGRPIPKMFKISDEQGPDIVRIFWYR